MTIDLAVGQSYDFLFQAPQILGVGYTNAKVEAITGYQIASLVNPDLVYQHAQVYPYLTGGVNEDPTTLKWVILKTAEGETRALAFDWLAAQPVIANYHDVNFYIKGVSVDNIAYIRDLLVNEGFTNFSYTQV